ncbi:retinaldehyde-binding protein 1-like [Ctenocephalides felis]|uniref:retinaldehyde-binding protein 1-like n=1 Tax=Ctenocephalides felis TaxID=7515 RepID=UPI000E6E3EB5|nr:retinaldehyde-binding protein 1-like [Ctenocephalides felis]
MATTKAILSYPWRSSKNSKSNETNICPKLNKTSQLSEAVAAVAKNELREDKSSREQSLQQLKEWIAKNRDIEDCRTDDLFLLRFLRVKKFSVPMAQQMLLKYLNLRKTFPHFALKLDFLSPTVQEIIDAGYIFPSPIKDKHGRRVVFYIASNFDPYKYSNADQARVHFITYETLLEDQENQVMGLTHAGDLKGAQAAHVSLWTVSEFARIVKWGEHSIPMRHKQVHVLNMPSAIRYVYEFSKTRISAKIKDRIMIHQDLNAMHEHLDKACLPAEYGGTIPIREMVQLWKKELTDKRNVLLALDCMKLHSDSGIITSKNPGQDCNNNNTKVAATESITGSFRKLEID